MIADRKISPNFLIVGAAKAGTTSLYDYLRQHPDIFMPEWKELSFFIGDPFGPLHRVRKPQHYYSVFSKAQGQTAVGEASTSYLYDKDAPNIINEKLRPIKILIILRDPVSMSYSLYNHEVRREGETIASFEAALAAESNRRKSLEFKKKCYGWHANYYYFQRGLYYNQVKRYIDAFGGEKVKIFLFDELTKDPFEVAREAFRFLGVDDTFLPSIEVHNPAGSILKIPKFWTDRGLFVKTSQFVLSKNLIKKIPHLFRNFGRELPAPINPATAQNLRKLYQDDICRLENLIGKDLAAWKVESDIKTKPV
ncbi:sulfotransferase domain-containing protein [Thermodesulfobacteriota bacterium]